MKKRTPTYLALAARAGRARLRRHRPRPRPGRRAGEADRVEPAPHLGPDLLPHVNYTAFGNKVKEKSGGRMEIRFHPASSLYPGPELLPALLDGRAEIAPVLASYLTDVLLEMGPLELPFMTSSMEEHKKAAFQLPALLHRDAGQEGPQAHRHEHVALAADLLHRAHPHRGRLEGQEDPRLRRRLRQHHPARWAARRSTSPSARSTPRSRRRRWTGP